MKQLKDELKALQNEAKELKDNPQKAMEVQKKAMQTNMKYMMQSMKSTLFTFIPIILIFGWVNAHYAFEPITPNQEFMVQALFDSDGSNITLTAPESVSILSEPTQEIKANQASWALKAAKGDYFLEFNYRDKTYTKKIKVDYQSYENPITIIQKDGIKQIAVNNQKLVVINLLGMKLGWLWSYIIFSIIFSIFFRKWLKVY